jgi:hypothetical protein
MSTAREDELGREYYEDLVFENLFGKAIEMDAIEAEALLGTAGIDREVLQANLHRRFERQLRRYRSAGKPVPRLLEKAADDLLPTTAPARNEKELYRQAKQVVRRALERAKVWSRIAEGLEVPVFTMAYRHKKQLSERDKKILDAVTEALRKRVRDESK